MNKKFSTLMLGMLLTSAFASAQDPDPVKIFGKEIEFVEFGTNGVEEGTYFVIKSDNSTLEANADQILSVEKDADGKLVYKAFYISNVANEAAGAPEDQSAYEWSVDEVTGLGTSQYCYAFKNTELGTFLTFDANKALVDDPEKSNTAAAKDGYTSLFSVAYEATPEWKENGQPLFAYGYGAGASGINLNVETTNANVQLGAHQTFYLAKFKENELTPVAAATALNKAKGGAGFNLEFSAEKDYDWANDILTDANLKAFYVRSNIKVNTNYLIPSGVYFATDYPASLATTNQIEKVSDFEACTFVAVDPDKNYNIHEAAEKGVGFEFTTVKGSDLNLYSVDDESENVTEGSTVYVGNACFTVIEPDPLNAAGEYRFKLAKVRHLKDLTKEEQTSTSGLYVGYVADQNENFLITVNPDVSGTVLEFTTTNSTLYDVTKLLKSEDVPSIYTMQFVSEVNKTIASENGQYLTIGEVSDDFVLSAVENMSSEDPMFQFVITAVDKDNKTVTFANRQTKEKVKVSLYENEDGSFTVYSGADLYISTVDDANTKNGVVEFKLGKLQNTKVILTAVTVEDKFATFVNREEGAGLVTFEVANNVDDATAFYVGIEKNDDGKVDYTGEIVAYTDEAAQFELIKNKDANGEDVVATITNNYVYLNSDRVINSAKKDTVAYNTYKIKAFTEDDTEAYVTWNNVFKLTNTESSALNFAIKNNVDGSVSLIDLDKELNYQADVDAINNNYLAVSSSINDEEAAWSGVHYYDLKSQLSEGLKTFMVGEDPTLSYEAVPQHVSFEAVRGGFLTKDENNDARLAISNTATEDLTFWLDTVHSDRNIPSFYIMKNGAFMYNATDSATTYTNKGNYRFNLENNATSTTAKLIFKAGELVTSDTIRTMVNGQSVLVTYNDNAPKNIKGALDKFQYQIVRAEAGSDEYVIRQNGKYVSQYNNYFYMDADKEKAYRFVIEKQAAPTANEGIEVSEVKVIAGNGQITIMGAAGKKVVVSNILGKVVASQTISSDNATFAVPAGIVAVAVEGEAAVKAVVK